MKTPAATARTCASSSHFISPGPAPQGPREVVRGKPENFNRPDYNFRLVGNHGAEPKGHEQVQISVRQRGAPLDLIVAEAMIVANSTWGSWMAGAGRARHLPQPGQHGAGREGAHGHQGAAARGHWRQSLFVGHLAAAPLHRPGQPVADHCLRPPRRHGCAGRTVQAGMQTCSPSSAALMRPTAPTTATRRAWNVSGRSSTSSKTGHHRAERPPSSRKGRAAAFWCGRTTFRWSSRAGRAKPAARRAPEGAAGRGG